MSFKRPTASKNQGCARLWISSAIRRMKIPREIQAHWDSIQVKDGDSRLSEERFQVGHMIGIYWATVARWMMMRAKRDAKALRTPLILVQAADVSKPPMPVAAAKKLMNVASPKDSGNMHGMLALHIGMRIRLLDGLDENKMQKEISFASSRNQTTSKEWKRAYG